jgi:hypothetical protein
MIVLVGAIHFRYYRLPDSLRPSKSYDTGFWVSVIAIVILAGLSVWTAVQKFLIS